MQEHSQYKYLISLAMLYMTIKLITVVLIYKVITLGPFVASVSALIIPLWFFLGDIIAEVYGYQVSRYLLWMALFCQFIFAIVCASMIKLHSPLIFNHQEAYNQVLGKLPKVVIASFLAIFLGAFINLYAISKWKILLRGKYFWLRSIGATAIGEAIFTIVAYVIEFAGTIPSSKLIQLIAVSYSIKLLIDPIAIIPALFLANLLKNLEGVDIYDYNTNFNPFKFELQDKPINETENR